MAEDNPFIRLGEGMKLYETDQEHRVGKAIGQAAHAYNIPTATASVLLKALIEVGGSVERALFCDAVVAAYTRYMHDTEQTMSFLRRVSDFLGKAASLEEFEHIVTRMSQKPKE